MFTPEELLAYVAVAAVLVLVPGPNTALIVAHSLAGGRRAGLATAAGVELGTLAHTAAAASGLSAVLASSAFAFDLVKLVGAAVLVVLGVGELLGTGVAPNPRPGREAVGLDPRAALVRAFVGNALNPKVAIFFLAFLPQWVDPSRGSTLLQFVLLGLILSILGGLCGCVLALGAAGAASRLTHYPGFWLWQRRVTGSVLVAVGLRLAWLEAG